MLDTHILVWLAGRDRNLKAKQLAAITDPDNGLFVSAVAAFELTYLQSAKRIAFSDPVSVLQEAIGFDIVDLPASCWMIGSELPLIHRDPIDRMQIAHAIIGDFTLVTADRDIRRYPVPCI